MPQRIRRPIRFRGAGGGGGLRECGRPGRPPLLAGLCVAGRDAKLTNNVVRKGEPHGHDVVQQLPGTARQLRDGGAGAVACCKGERQDTAVQHVGCAPSRCPRRGWSRFTGSRMLPAADVADAGARVGGDGHEPAGRPARRDATWAWRLKARPASPARVTMLSAKDSGRLRPWLRQENATSRRAQARHWHRPSATSRTRREGGASRR